MLKVIIFLFISLCYYNRGISGECCTRSVSVRYYCNSINHNTCTADVCYDGTRKTSYCGIGKCNIFGCNCDGGCRPGTKESGAQKFKELNSYLTFLEDS